MKTLFNVVIVLIVIAVAIKTYNREMEIKTWPATQGTITAYSVEKNEERKSYKNNSGVAKTHYEKEFSVRFYYEYQVDGFNYDGSFVVGLLEKNHEINNAISSHQNGSKINLRYDPTSHQDSVHRS